MFDDRDQETFEAALETWGTDAQIDMASEECAEYIVASHHFRRNRIPEEDVIDEIADLRIMVEQLTLVFGEHRVKHRVRKKMERLEERIDDA